MSKYVSRKRVCPECNGEKVVEDNGNGEKPCPRCNGKGWVISPSMI